MEDADLSDSASGPRVHRQSRSRRLLRRPATGVSGQSLSSSEDDESLFSPTRGDLGRGGEMSRAVMVELGFCGGSSSADSVGFGVVRVESFGLSEWCLAEGSESVESAEASVDARE